MNKVLTQFLVLVAIFLSAYFGLARVDFMKRLHLGGISRKTENKIGGIIVESIKKSNKYIENDSVAHVLDKIKNRICVNNAIPPDDITIDLVYSNEVNAFAIPGHHIIVYTGLINHCDSVSELCGVLGHEIAHIRQNHVMKRLANEIGIGLLAAVASNGNSKVVGQIVKLLSSTAFERKQESEADAASVHYLEQANINPRGFASIMRKLADMHGDNQEIMQWISTHPDSKARAETILSLINTNKQNYTPVVSEHDWQTLKGAALGKGETE